MTRSGRCARPRPGCGSTRATAATVTPVLLDVVELAYVPAGRALEAAARDDRITWRLARGDSGSLGMHNLRHFYSATLQDAGVSPVGVTEFLGHSKKAPPVTFRGYGHVTEETFDQARQAVEALLFRLRPVESGGTVTELRTAR